MVHSAKTSCYTRHLGVRLVLTNHAASCGQILAERLIAEVKRTAPVDQLHCRCQLVRASKYRTSKLLTVLRWVDSWLGCRPDHSDLRPDASSTSPVKQRMAAQ